MVICEAEYSHTILSEGLQSQSLPVTVVSGKGTFKADLRLRVQAGAEASLDIFGIGAGAVVGIYANIIEFVAVIEETPSCPLEADFWWDLNVGAYAHLDVRHEEIPCSRIWL